MSAFMRRMLCLFAAAAGVLAVAATIFSPRADAQIGEQPEESVWAANTGPLYLYRGLHGVNERVIGRLQVANAGEVGRLIRGHIVVHVLERRDLPRRTTRCVPVNLEIGPCGTAFVGVVITTHAVWVGNTVVAELGAETVIEVTAAAAIRWARGDSLVPQACVSMQQIGHEGTPGEEASASIVRG